MSVWAAALLSKLTKSRYNTAMMNVDEQQVLSLAATLQALRLVQAVATEGKFDTDKAAPVLQALVSYNPDDTLEAYGGNLDALQPGMALLRGLFTENPDRDLSQYLLTVIAIELKLVRDARMRRILQTEMQRLAQQAHHQPAFDDNEISSDELFQGETALVSDDMLAEFAALYKQTASQTEPRIMVKGNQQFLQQESSANQIRALLLAALRGAAFYRHNGGKRFDLMVKRKQYLHILASWLSR